MDIPDHDIVQEVLRSGPFAYYRGRRRADDRRVLLKLAVRAPARPVEADALEREFEVLRDLASPLAPAPLELGRSAAGPFLVLEDRGLRPLAERFGRTPLDLTTFFRLAVRLASTLGQLHRRFIIQGAISPFTVLIGNDEGDVQFIDFSLASRGSVDGATTGRTAWSATPYVSPEQTGRINRSIDHRTDFYSLGATLYEVLTGRPPFEADDSLELLHAHIARMPVAPASLRRDVPETVSRIVMRLLAKAAEHRYQSALGVQQDFEACERAWLAGESLGQVELGRRDVSERFLIPQRLYGRDAEIERLVGAFDATVSGRTSLTLVSGYSGIGKTALIGEFSRRVVHRGYFVSGKFDQVVRNIPYGALIQAFRSLVWQWLAEHDDRLNEWKSRLTDALGANAAVLAELIPEIEFVLGKQPAPTPLDPAEAQNRFRYVFESFVRTIARSDRPLVLFLDDLQWVDPATLDLLSALLTSPDVRHLLLVGAYRDNEVDPGHLLAWAIVRLEASGAPLERLSLGPLGLDDADAFLRDTLHASGERVRQLARLILEKTDGNPFFVIQFLKALQQDGLFRFDRERGAWDFTIDDIAATPMTDNVIDLMTRRIRRLSRAARSALTLAACIGNPFRWQTFLTASGQSAADGQAALAEIIDVGLVHRVGAPMAAPEDRDSDAITYAFLHDRVQQAAYGLMPDEQRLRAHLEVGRLLRGELAGVTGDERLFEIVEHLNIGSRLIDTAAERMEVAALNLAAGRKAKLSTAYLAACGYLNAGIAMLSDTHWTSHYELMFGLHLEAAECEYLAGHFEEAESYFALLLGRASSPIDKAHVHSLRIVLYENLSRFDDAIRSAREGLALFDLGFPEGEAALQEALEKEIAGVQRSLGERRIGDLIGLPVMSDTQVRTVMRILTSVWPAAYISGNHLLARLVSATMVRLSLAHGNTEDSAYGYVTHAITIGPVRGDYASAYQWGELALRINEQFGDTKRRAKIQQQFHAHVKLWRRPFETCIPHAREARRSGLDAGDFTYAGYAAVSESWPAFVSSRSLDQFVREYSTAFALLDRIRMKEFSEALRVIVNWALALQGRTSAPLSLSDAAFHEAVFVSRFESSAPFFLTFYYTARLHLCVLHREFRTALELARCARQVTVPGTLWPVLIDFWESIAIGGAWSAASDDERAAYRERLNGLERRFSALAANCPENFRCFSLLVAATRHRVEGYASDASKLWEEAISFANETDNVQMQALANELAGDAAAADRDRGAAAAFIRHAHHGYARWGATAKLRQLEAAYPFVFTGPDSVTRAQGMHMAIGEDASSLDMAAVLKVARAITAEIRLDDLLRKLMHVVMENAGAERAVFVQDRDGTLTIEAEAVAQSAEVRLGSKRLGEEPNIALGVVRYVRRTGQDVVVGDATLDERFAKDSYVAATQLRSVLCVPVGQQGRHAGALYLENNLAADVFTPKRTEMMRILAAQAAISLENARLYDGMLEEVDRRTRAEQSLRDTLAELQLLKNRLEAENVYLQEEIRTQHNFNEIVGNSPALLDALRRVEPVAATDATVLILGETGSGKELFARAIHARSRRRERPLVKVNCGAIPPSLLESELFGHVKGAFTGAVEKRTGRFELANGGTIFLDEVGELPLDAQVKLLRVLQEREFEPVGSSRTIRVDVRVIAATNRELAQAVREGTFRADLLYRLNVFPIDVPPLRDRRGDIPQLAGLFVSGLSRKLGKPLHGFSNRSMERLIAYSWPGNVRELQNVVERAAIVAKDGILELDRTFGAAHPMETPRGAPGDTLDSVQRAHIVSVLTLTGGVVEGTRGAASILGLHPNTLRSRMKKLGITVPRPTA